MNSSHHFLSPSSIFSQLPRFLIAVLILFSSMFPAAKAVEYELKQRESWVKIITPDFQAVNKDNQTSRGVFYLLADHQVKVEGTKKSTYRHIALKALNEQGLDQLGHVEIWFDPSYHSLSLHTVSLRRGNRVIDKLNGAKIQILQREKELEARIYDGSKTANIFLEDVQVGDVLEYSYTLSGSNPVFQGHQFGGFDLQMSVPVQQIYNRLLVSKEKQIHFSFHNTENELNQRKLGSEDEYVWEKKQVAALIVPADTPAWHEAYPYVSWGDFRDWASVARWATPLYQLPQRLNAPLQKVVQNIAAQYAKPTDRMMAALLYVQKEIRYLGVEIGANSHAPNAPDVVLGRRFGDCKDKALLTLTLLQALGVQAHAALVNTQVQRGILQYEPSPNAFNHVLIRAQIDGRDYWVDPTRSKQVLSSEKVYQPDYGYALIVDPKAKSLTPMAKTVSQIQKRIVHTVVDSSAGLDKPSLFVVTTTYDGISAEMMRNTLASENLDDLQKRYLNFYARYYPSVSLSSPMRVENNEVLNQLTVTEFYTIPQLWIHNKEKARTESNYYAPDIDGLLLRPSQTIRNTPLALTHPYDLLQVTEIRLPSEWKVTEEKKEFSGPGFKLQHEVQMNDQTVVLRDHYRSAADQLMPDQTAKHVETIEAAKASLGFMIWQNDAVEVAETTVDDHDSSVANNAQHIDTHTNWIAVALSFMFALVFGQLAWAWYCREHGASSNKDLIASVEPLRIGGWLFVIAFSVSLTPLRIALDLFAMDGFKLSVWLVLMNPAEASFRPSLLPLIIFELAANIAACIFSLVVAVFFYQKRRVFPLTFICVFTGIFLFRVLDLVLPEYLLGKEHAPESKEWYTLIGSAFYLVLWSSYLMTSERVRNTFIRDRSSRVMRDSEKQFEIVDHDALVNLDSEHDESMKPEKTELASG